MSVLSSSRERRRLNAYGVILAMVSVVSCSSSTALTSTSGAVSTAAPTTAAPPTATTTTTTTTTATTAAATTTTTPVDVSSTPYGVELANVADDGVRSLDSTLKLFSLAVAPLPGVDVTPDRAGVRSGTLALKNVLAHYDELTPEQKAAVDEARQPPPSAETAIVPAGFVRTPQTAVKDAVVAAVKQYRAAIAAKIGNIPGDISVVVVAIPTAYGIADPHFKDGTYSGCTVRIDAVKQTDPLVILNTVGHEVFHCFEAAGAKTVAVWNATGDWMIEGASEWAGSELSAPDGTDAGYWRDYLTKPKTPLFAWTYQGIGFFSHLAETGTSPWSVFPAMFKAVGSAAEFAASGADADPFMTSWASGFYRDRARGSAWDTTGPGITDDSVVPTRLSIGNGESKPFVAPPYRHASFVLQVTADVLIVQASGYARLNDGSTDVAKLSAEKYCTRSGGCGKCPDGTPLLDNPGPLATDPLLAVSSGATQSSGTVVGLTVEDYCKNQTKVWVHFERPATPGVIAGNVVELYGCRGPFGPWQGVLRSGGLDDGNGFTVAFSDIPVSFAFAGFGSQTVHTSANGNVPTPIGNITVALELDIGIDTAGSTMSITGTGTAASNIISVSDYLGTAASALPIEPAPAGTCQ